MHTRHTLYLFFCTLIFSLTTNNVYAFFDSSVTEYKNGTTNDISNKTFESVTNKNALGVYNKTTVTGKNVEIKSNNNQDAALLYLKNGGILKLEDATLTGTNLRDSAIVQRHRLFSSDVPGTSLLELKNSSVELTTDPANTQPLVHMESTDSTTPISFQSESTAFHVNMLNDQQELFSLATYATLSMTGTEGKKSSITIDDSGSNTKGIYAGGANVDLNYTDITVRHGGGHAIFGYVLSNYPFVDPNVTTSPTVTFRNGIIKVDQGAGIAGLQGGTYHIDHADITSNGYGVYLSGHSAAFPFVFDMSDTHINTSAGSSAALLLRNLSTVSTSRPDGAFTFSNSTIQSEGTNTVWIHDDDTGNKSKQLQFTGSSILNANPETGNAFSITGSNLDTPTTFSLKNSTVEGNIALTKDTGATASFDMDGSTLTGGRVYSANGGALNMVLRNASTAYAGAALTNLSLDDSSRWILNSRGGTQNEANISGLLLNEGSIAFERDRLPSLLRAAPSFSSFSRLTTRDLDGNGAFYMGVDIADDQADSLIVTGSATGAHALYVTNSGAEPTRERMQSHLVEAANGDARFSLGNQGGYVEAGLYLYELSHEAQGDSGTAWYLKRASTDPVIPPVDPVDPPVVPPVDPVDPPVIPPVDPVDPPVVPPIDPVDPPVVPPVDPIEPPVIPPVDPVDPPVDPIEPPVVPPVTPPVQPVQPAAPILTPTAEVVLGLSGMAPSYAMWYGQLSNLRDRLGEIRYGIGKDGFWTRGFAQENKLDGLKGIDVSQKVYGGSLGYDRSYQSDPDSKWLFGFRGQVSRAEQDVNANYGGSGDNNSYGFAGYATWQHRSGWYVDSVATWDWYHQDLKTHMLDGRNVKGSYHSYGGGLSLEAGRSINLWGKAFLEPQAQLSYYWLKGSSFTMDNGMEVSQRDMNSLTGRVGLVLGKKWSFEDNTYIQPYAKVGGIHEFLGSQKVSVNGETFTGDLQGSRVYYGVGVDWQFTDAAKLYGEFKREDGEHISQTWGVSVGLRYAF
ncbi:autotransporter outer membrane beta-barrel domain-containing protein [uncultured Bilophila sp.]|uniref:autotransporter family protein n=1 Tax=uncultured Bilophila sp. TaxID=529385 RepID=UPI00280A8042|nr:autotransporter outer membrane beta-barrel domain-containing protein [uncultured Bilophila sp.]